jgi:hypothetical protein
MTEPISLLTSITGAITSGAGAVIAWMLYRLSENQQKDAWLKVYKEVHEAFWDDFVMAEVRSWIACEQSYLELKQVLQKRKDIDEGKLSADNLDGTEYVLIDKLDKFLNLVLRINVVNSQLSSDYGQRAWKTLFIEYWLIESMKENRSELNWYVQRFFPEVLDSTLLLAQSIEGKGKRRYAKKHHLSQ